jgi:hypothetical protein
MQLSPGYTKRFDGAGGPQGHTVVSDAESKRIKSRENLIGALYEDNGIKYREYRALGNFQALQRTDQGSKLATRPYISRPFP